MPGSVLVSLKNLNPPEYIKDQRDCINKGLFEKEVHTMKSYSVSLRYSRASIKSFRPTPNVSFHLLTYIRVLQWTFAQVRVRGSLYQSKDDISSIPTSSVCQRRVLERVQLVDVGPSLQKNRDYGRVLHGGVVQRRRLKAIEHVDVAATFDKGSHN